MRRYLYLLSPVLVLLSVSYGFAQQSIASDAPPEEKLWQTLLKLAFPFIMTMVGPYLTSFLKTAPEPVKYVVSGLVSMLLGAGAGTIPDFPIYPESAATIGLASGIAGQKLFNTQPAPPAPAQP
jgi:hypothetical protein